MSEQMTDAEYYAWVRKMFETAQRESIQDGMPVHEITWNGCITLYRDGTLILEGIRMPPHRAALLVRGLAWMFQLAARAKT